jgi:hypothetical protein
MLETEALPHARASPASGESADPGTHHRPPRQRVGHWRPEARETRAPGSRSTSGDPGPPLASRSREHAESDARCVLDTSVPCPIVERPGAPPPPGAAGEDHAQWSAIGGASPASSMAASAPAGEPDGPTWFPETPQRPESRPLGSR